MSKAVKQSIAILAVLLFVSIGVALVTFLDKQRLQNQNKSLGDQIADYQTKQTQLIAEGAKLKDQVQTLTSQLADKDKDQSKYQTQYQELKDKYDQLNGQITQVSRERDDLKDRTTTITQERDKLMKELQDRPEKVVEKVVYKEKEPPRGPAPAEGAVGTTPAGQTPDNTELAAANPSGNAAAKPDDAASVVAQAQADSAKQQKDES